MKLTLSELKDLLNGKEFFNTETNIKYWFYDKESFIINKIKINSTKYSIYEENDKFYLIQNGVFGTEDLEIEIEKENPLTLKLTFKFSRDKVLPLWQEDL